MTMRCAAPSTPKASSRRLRLTMPQALALSLALHVALGAPLVHLLREDPATDETETLVVDLDGLVSDRQESEKAADDPTPAMREQAQDEARRRLPRQAQQNPAPPPQKQEEATDDPADPAPPQAAKDAVKPAETVQPSPAPAAAVETPAIDDDARKARTLARRQQQDEDDAMRKYGARLVKRVQARLIYPSGERGAGSQGVVKLAFTIRADGTVDPASLKIIVSSGRAGLDAAARATILKSAPYPPPPSATTVAFSLYFGKRQ